VLVLDGYKFKFFSNENNELPHVHIVKGDGNAKYWLAPACHEEYSYGFNVRERRDIKALVVGNRELLIQKWHEYFSE